MIYPSFFKLVWMVGAQRCPIFLFFLLRERNKDARKEIAAARTPQECTENDDFCGNIWMVE
jgi:hypothetical protein